MIPQSFIQELLNKLDIVEVVERYLPLKKAGGNFIACCPFHQEKTPSFTVSPSKQFYHCFGCGAHGTAISFVMAFEARDFIEAVEDLAAQRGLVVPKETRAARQPAKHENLAELLEEAMAYYCKQLKASDVAINYLKQRGLDGKTAAMYRLGYAPPGWHNITGALPHAEPAAMMRAGLTTENESGKRYDRFRDRIMFPIINPRGVVIGFGGRVLGQGEPKYLNSPETPLFEKGQELYGLFQARRAIHASGKALVVEGYMDVVALAQYGIHNAVATLGTATSTAHLHQLARLCNEIIFCFDGDEAGRKAAWRAFEQSLPALSDTKQFSFLFLPENEDPDSYVRKFGPEKFIEEMKSAIPLSQFFVQELSSRFNLKSDEGRSAILKAAQPYLDKMAARGLVILLRKRFADLVNVSDKDLSALLPQKAFNRVGEKRPAIVRKAPASPIHTIIKALLAHPELASHLDRGELEETDEAHTAVLVTMLDFVEQHPGLTHGAALLQFLASTPHYQVIQNLLKELLEWDEGFDIKAEFFGALEKLQANLRQKRINELRRQAGALGWTADRKRELQQLLQRSS